MRYKYSSSRCLSEGSDFKSEVPDEPKGKSGDSGDEANEQGESDDDNEQADDERTESNNPRTSDNEEETQDDEYAHTPEDYVPTDDETNDETNDVDEEEYDRINKVYGDVNVRLTNVEPDAEDKGHKEMTNAETVEGKHENVNQEGVGNQVRDDAQATQKTEVPIPSSSISSDYAAKFLNFDNIPPVDTEVVSMLDINVQHEAPRTSPILTIPVFVIPKHTVINPSETITTASSTTISSLLTSLFPNLQQSTPIPTPTTTEATTSTTVVPDSETLTALHQRIADLEKDVKELKDVDNSTKVISTIQFEVLKAVKEYLGSSMDDAMYKVIQRNFDDIVKEHSVPAKIVERLRQQYAPQKSIEDIREIKMEHARKQQVPKETITLFDTTALGEFDQKTTLFETMTKSKSFNKSPKQRALYHALMKRKTSKYTEPSKKAKSTETSKGTSKSQPKSTGKSAQADEIVFEAVDTQGPQNLGEDTGNTDEPPVVNIDPKDWFKKLKRPPTLDLEWNKGKSIKNKPTQKWLSDLAKAEKPLRTFDDLISTLIDFGAFVMNRLQISELTQDILVGPAYNILKGTCRSYVELDYNMEEYYKALTDQLDWNNPEGDRYPFDLSKPLPLTKAAKYDLTGIKDMVPNLWSPIKVSYDKHALLGTSYWGLKRQSFYGYASNRVSIHDVYSTKRILVVTNVKVKEWYGYGHLKEIEVQRFDQQLYKFMEGDFPRLNLYDIEDMLILLVQNRLFNLKGDVIVHLAATLRMFTRRIVIQKRVEDLQLGVESYQKKLNIFRPMTHKARITDLKPYYAYSNPQGFIYVDKLGRNRLMCFHELYKFSDGTDEVFSTWIAFRGNTHDLGSFGEKTEKITDLHQIHKEVLFIERGDGVAGIKQHRRDLSSDDVRDLATTLGRGLLKEDLESST
ncbi:hypothetical protein Tco_0862135 [Tanacetum coccineum]